VYKRKEKLNRLVIIQQCNHGRRQRGAMASLDFHTWYRFSK